MEKLNRKLTSWSILLTLAISFGCANSQATTKTKAREKSSTSPVASKIIAPVASGSTSCKIDLTPIAFRTQLRAESKGGNIYFVWKGRLLLSEGTDIATKKPNLVFNEQSTVNFITPVLGNVARTVQDNLNAIGKKSENCQNSFNGATAWVTPDLPPRLGAKAGMTKRACTCISEGNCTISDVTTDEVTAIWRIDAKRKCTTREQPQKKEICQDIELPIVLESRSDDSGGGDVFKVLKDWGIVNIIDDVFKTGIMDSTRDLDNAFSIANIPNHPSLPKPPNHTLYIREVKWDKPNVDGEEFLRDTRYPDVIYPIERFNFKVEPYALTTERTYEFPIGIGCNLAACIREFGMDSVGSSCPYLGK